MHRILNAAVATASGVALTFTVTVANELPASAATGCQTTFNSYQTIKKGTSGSQVKAAQCLLRSAGYRVRADGTFSAADSAQLKRFQRTHDVNVTGNVYASSWTALLARGPQRSLSLGKQGEVVKRLQRALTASGRYVPATGYYGAITTSAVKSVQRASGLRVTGTANGSVWRVLQAGDAIVTVRRVAKKQPVRAAAFSTSASKGTRALAFAKRQLGDRYVWGAAGPNAWDCSGLTMGAWRSVGVRLPHNARQQFRTGRKISKSNLRPGDLVFFYRGISHVGIYAGNGKIIHASRRGKPVQYTKMSYMPYRGAIRPA